MHRYLMALIFLLFASNSYGQKTTATATVNTGVTIRSNAPEASAGQVLRLYPNPADKYVNIYVEWPEARSFTISIYDYNFDAWIKEIPVDVRKSYQYSLDVSQLQNGKYKVLLKSNGASYEDELKIAR